MLVDSHCHLDFPDFADDLDAVVERARAAGVGRMVTICTRVSRFAQVRAVAERYPDILCTVGVHPHHAADELSDATVARLTTLADDAKVVGIGETGLDYFYDKSPRDQQSESFRRHIRACLETGLPLIVHTRDADADTITILREEAAGSELRGLMHCFSSSRQLAEQAVEFGFMISLSGIVTFKKSEELRAIARDVPLDRLLVETDAPYLAPVPKRGKRNEPAFVAHTAAAVAEVKGVTSAALAAATTANFFRLFRRAAPCG
ncbi:MAG: YchF/TatD family DNA exonuclease [Azospirillum sp.]|nr:YchF/TatD family DNA exonuclease [Azospirillum sp.]